MDRAPRMVGIAAAWLWLVFSSMRIESVGGDARANPWLRAVVVVGFFTAPLILARLCIAEGRAREREERSRGAIQHPSDQPDPPLP